MTKTNILIGNKRQRENDSITKEFKRRRICNDDNLEMKDLENIKKILSFTKESKTAGFKDEDFHIINESDEEWIFHANGRVEKNIVLTELVLSEKEIQMVAVVKEHFEN